ncbi:hypothetical protein HDV63DRAFT_378875 [Trichoderma sp. SZMC 28014]
MRLDFRRLIALWAVAIPYIANQRLPINLSGKCSVAVSCGARSLQSNRALATNIRLSPSRCNCKPAAAMGPPKPPLPHVAPIYRVTATALGAGMWFWLMYRAKKDGPVLLGWKHPWDH